MSTLLALRTIRCKSTLGNKISESGLTEVNTSQVIETWRGNATRFEFGFFAAKDLLPMDLSNVSTLNLKIQPEQKPGGSVVADQTLALADLDLSLDAESWDDGSKQHAAFVFTNAEMNLNPEGLKKSFWLVVTAIMTSGREVTLAAGTFNIHEDNNVAGDPPPENVGTAITLEQADARYLPLAGSAEDGFLFVTNTAGGRELALWNDTQSAYQMLRITGAEGSETLQFINYHPTP